MSDSEAQSQKSVHEILSSIRQIISEDVHQEIQNTLLSETKKVLPLSSVEIPEPEVLDLTKMIDDSGAIVNLNQSININSTHLQEKIPQQPSQNSAAFKAQQEKTEQDFMSSEAAESKSLVSHSVLNLYHPLEAGGSEKSPAELLTTEHIAPVKSIDNKEQDNLNNIEFKSTQSVEEAKPQEAQESREKLASEIQNPLASDPVMAQEPHKEVLPEVKQKSDFTEISNTWTFDAEAFSRSMPQSSDENSHADQSLESTSSIQDIVLSQDTMQESVAAFAELKRATQQATLSKAQPNIENVGGYTVENLMKELLRPLLKEWLDAQLPSLVRTLVVEQIAKVLQQLNQKS